MKLKILEAFCGRGGFSRPFADDGDETVGIDIKDFSKVYPGRFIRTDIRNFHPDKEFDLVIGSPECRDFSKVGAKGIGQNRANVVRGLSLIEEFLRVKNEAKAPFWAFENVTRLQKFYSPKPILTFRMGAMAQRALWGNIPFGMKPDFRFPNRILASRMGRFYAKRKGVKPLDGQRFAEIPYPVARFIADTVKHHLGAEFDL